jgi:hypothetical protein
MAPSKGENLQQAFFAQTSLMEAPVQPIKDVHQFINT